MSTAHSTTAYINRIATAVPAHDVHRLFIDFAESLLEDHRLRGVFTRMSQKAQIDHRYSCLVPADVASSAIDRSGLYRRGAFAATGPRMEIYEQAAPVLAAQAVAGLDLGAEADRVTHVIVTTCTGLMAPGIDLDLVGRLGLKPTVERTVIGFMGCYAGINALKAARHIVRSEPESRVLIVNVELCTLHLQETQSLEQILSFLVFADGAAACLVTSEAYGIALDRFHAVVLPDTERLITWEIRDRGFDMFLSGQVPSVLRQGLEQGADRILAGMKPSDLEYWAIHPGGRSILDAVEHGLGLGANALGASRHVLREFGNMSSASVMFVLHRLMASLQPGGMGLAMAFGPGLTAETMLFHGAA